MTFLIDSENPVTIARKTLSLESEIENPETNSNQPQPPLKPAIEPARKEPAQKEPARELKQISLDDIWDKPHSHMIFLAIAYAFGLFVAVCGLSESPLAAVFIFPIVLSTVVLTAAWSVFGPGNYFQRLFFAHLVGTIPAIGLMAGSVVMMLSNGVISFNDSFIGVLVGALSIAPLSLAAQLPFWFFRGCFGWQFVLGDGKPELPFNLKDIFALTFMFALSFAVPQLVFNATNARYNNFADFEHETVEVTNPDGTTTYERRKISEEEAQIRRAEMQQMMQQSSLMGYGMMMVFVFIGTSMCIPVLLFVFRSKEQSTGCAYTALYAFALAVIPLMLILVGGGPFIGEAIFYIGFTFALCGGGLVIPFAISREAGFILTSPKKYARLHGNQEELDAIYKKAEMDPPKPLDPFAD